MYVYCAFPDVLVHSTLGPSIPAGMLTLRSRQTVLLPTPESATAHMLGPSAPFFVKDLGESPVNTNVVLPITWVVTGPVTPGGTSVMPPPVAEPVFVPERAMSPPLAKAGTASSPDIV